MGSVKDADQKSERANCEVCIIEKGQESRRSRHSDAHV